MSFYCFNDTFFINAENFSDAVKIFNNSGARNSEKENTTGPYSQYFSNGIKEIMQTLSFYYGYTLFCGPSDLDFRTRIDNIGNSFCYVSFEETEKGSGVMSFKLTSENNTFFLPVVKEKGIISYLRLKEEIDKAVNAIKDCCERTE